MVTTAYSAFILMPTNYNAFLNHLLFTMHFHPLFVKVLIIQYSNRTGHMEYYLFERETSWYTLLTAKVIIDWHQRINSLYE
jgi:hypothetical protein